MKIVVMKFGGTSVRDQAIRFQALNHIRREVKDPLQSCRGCFSNGKKWRTLRHRYIKTSD